MILVLSGIVDGPLDTIVSGPAGPGSSTCADVRRAAEQYGLAPSPKGERCWTGTLSRRRTT